MTPEAAAKVSLLADSLSREQLSILDHTQYRAASGLFCGGGKDMEVIVAFGLMESAGRKSFVPEEYFRITDKGRRVLAACRSNRQSNEL